MPTLTASVNIQPSNLGATALHPVSDGNISAAEAPRALARSYSNNGNMNGGLNSPEPGAWSSLTPTVSDPSKWLTQV